MSNIDRIKTKIKQRRRNRVKAKIVLNLKKIVQKIKKNAPFVILIFTFYTMSLILIIGTAVILKAIT